MICQLSLHIACGRYLLKPVLEGNIEVKTASNLDAEWIKINIIKSDNIRKYFAENKPVTLYSEPIPIPLKKQWDAYHLAQYVPEEFRKQFPKPATSINGAPVTDDIEILSEDDENDDDDDEHDNLATTLENIVLDNKKSAVLDMFKGMHSSQQELVALIKAKDIPFTTLPPSIKLQSKPRKAKKSKTAKKIRIESDDSDSESSESSKGIAHNDTNDSEHESNTNSNASQTMKNKRKFVVLDDDDGDNHEGSPITNEDSNDSLDIPSTLSKWSKTNYQVKKLVMLDGITTRSNAKKKMRLI